jgi:hypothetical protein
LLITTALRIGFNKKNKCLANFQRFSSGCRPCCIPIGSVDPTRFVKVEPDRKESNSASPPNYVVDGT